MQTLPIHVKYWDGDIRVTLPHDQDPALTFVLKNPSGEMVLRCARMYLEGQEGRHRLEFVADKDAREHADDLQLYLHADPLFNPYVR